MTYSKFNLDFSDICDNINSGCIMKEECKVFSEQYNNLLDLVELVDEKLASKYEDVIESLPEVVKDRLRKQNKFVCDGKNFRAILDVYDDQLCFELTKYNKYFCTSISLQPFYEDEIADPETSLKPMDIDVDGLFIFSLTFINTEEEPMINLNYKQDGDEYKYIGAKINGVELCSEVFLERHEGEFYLVSKTKFNELEMYRKKCKVNYSDLIDCLSYSNVDSYSDDNEIT